MRAVLFSSLEFLAPLPPADPRGRAASARSAAAPLDRAHQRDLLRLRGPLVVHRADAGHHGGGLLGGDRDRARARGRGARRWLLAVSLAGNLGMLAYFKYSGLDGAHGRAGAGASLGLEDRAGSSAGSRSILPAGHQLLHVPDALLHRRRVARPGVRAERNFVRLRRLRQLLPAPGRGPDHAPPPARSRSSPASRGPASTPRWRAGILLFASGSARRSLIADRLGSLHRSAARRPAGARRRAGPGSALLGYAFQIYFDFSGYSDMAIGLGAHASASSCRRTSTARTSARRPRDFWRRWHITLSTLAARLPLHPARAATAAAPRAPYAAT